MPLQEIPFTDWSEYDMLPVGIIIIRRDYSILFWNDCIADWSGISAGEISGANLLERFPDLNRNVIRGRIDIVFDGGPAAIFSPQFHPHIIPAIHPAGGKRFQSTTVVPRRAGAELHAMIVIEDVTDIYRQTREYRDLKNSAENELAKRKCAEDALRESEEKYRTLVENANSIILKVDKTGKITFFNEFAQRFFGYTNDEIIGKPAIGTLVPVVESESGRDLQLMVDDIVRHPGSYNFNENENITRDGKRVWVRWQNKTLMDENGQYTGLLSIGTDSTARKQAEEALQKAHDELEIRVQERTADLKESEERLKLKLDSILMPGTDISDLELINILDIPAIQSLMDDFSRLTGMGTAIVDLKGNVIESSGWTDICKKFHRINERSARFCKESDLFLSRNLKPGQYVAYKCRNNLWDVVTPLVIGDKHVGNIYTGQFFYKDEIIEDAVFFAQAEEFGFDREKYMAALRTVPRFSHEQINHLMDYMVKFSGIISRLSFSNLKLARSMTEQKRVQEELQTLYDELERRVIERTAELSKAQAASKQANKKLNLLSSITRHDINNQLMALNAYIMLSEEAVENPVELKEFILKEQRIADTMAHQIHFTKDYEEMGVKDPLWQNVTAIFKKIIPRLPMRNIRVDADDPNLELFADPLLEKVFYNLTDNALRYGGEKMTVICVTARKDNGGLILAVEDDGNGISTDDKAQLFTKGFGKHTGLGLFLSREILSLTGITIAENGEPGKGARFEMEVPEGAYRFAGKK